MDEFARNTKHRSRQLETDEDMSLIVKKFLCTQVPTFVDYKTIYPFVANDLESINFRAPGVLSDYCNQRSIDPILLQNILNNSEENLANANKMPIFNDYVERVGPPKGKEILAFFLHGQRKKNLESHINVMVDDFDERSRLYNEINNYSVPEHLNQRDIIQSLGSFMDEFKSNIYVSLEEKIESKAKENEKDYDEEVHAKKIQLSTPTQLEWNEQDHWENPVLKAFKIDAGLSTKFSCEKAYKQLLVSSCAPNHIELVSHLKGKYQNNIPRVNADIPIEYVDYISSDNIESIVQSEEAQNIYHGLTVKPKDNRELVKSLLLMNHPESVKFIQVSKKYNPDEKLSLETIKLLIK